MTNSDLKNAMQALKHLIGNSDCEQNDAELGILFDNCMQLRDLIENSTLSSIDNELQEAISTCIKALEKCTMMVNTLELFSCNETAEELQTASIRYLLLPAILGSLNLNVQNKNVSDRMTYVEIAEVYFKDFLRRCSDYELCESSLKYFKEILNKENSNEVNSDPSSVREKKIQLFKQKRELENKEMLLKSAILRPESEECIREYYFVLLEKWILIAVDELENLKREKEILISMPKKDISTSNIQDKKNVK
ncbi:immunoglobulin-binding protein 1b, partial [Nephila pilipes]